MEPFKDDERLAAELRALRPEPRPEFTAELDERAAAGFPRRSRLPHFPLGRLRAIQPRRILIPAGGMAVVAIAVTTAVVATSGTSEDSGSQIVQRLGPEKAVAPDAQKSTPATAPSLETFSEGATEAGGAISRSSGSNLNFDGSGVVPQVRPFGRDLHARLSHRAVERSAELVLAADPADVGEDSSKVFEAVHAHDGIVLSSSTREGKPGAAGARFELLIPSAKLGDALAALSAIDEVRSRHEATADITAPTVNVTELLQDSKARIDSLLAQLEEAEVESEREAVETELRQERRHRARLRASLQNLQRRADLSRVLVRIETGSTDQSSSDGGAWGIDDALGDAGKILAVAVAMAVVGLAILGPIALIALLAWLAHRAWVRRERRRVLS